MKRFVLCAMKGLRDLWTIAVVGNARYWGGRAARAAGRLLFRLAW